MLSFEAAMKKIGKEMGVNKFSNQMAGSFFPVGEVSTDWVLSIIYNGDRDAIEEILEALCDKQFKQKRTDYIKKWKEKQTK
jgi:hypothetical protein